MASFNKVILVGNLTRDPEKKYLPSGVAVADLGLAVNESYKNKEGEWVEKPVFIDVVVWDRQAENCAQYLSKGSPILVEGRLQLDTWETPQGEKRSKVRVRADRVQFLSGGGQRSSSDSSAASGSDAGISPPPAAAADDDDLPF